MTFPRQEGWTDTGQRDFYPDYTCAVEEADGVRLIFRCKNGEREGSILIPWAQARDLFARWLAMCEKPK